MIVRFSFSLPKPRRHREIFCSTLSRTVPKPHEVAFPLRFPRFSSHDSPWRAFLSHTRMTLDDFEKAESRRHAGEDFSRFTHNAPKRNPFRLSLVHFSLMKMFPPSMLRLRPSNDKNRSRFFVCCSYVLYKKDLI